MSSVRDITPEQEDAILQSVAELSEYIKDHWSPVELLKQYTLVSGNICLFLCGIRGEGIRHIHSQIELNLNQHDLTKHTVHENAMYVAGLLTDVLQDSLTPGLVGLNAYRYFFFGSQQEWQQYLLTDQFILNMFERIEEPSLHGDICKIQFVERFSGKRAVVYLKKVTLRVCPEEVYIAHNTRHTEILLGEATGTNIYLSDSSPTLNLPITNTVGSFVDSNVLIHVNVVEKCPRKIRVEYHCCKPFVDASEWTSTLYTASITDSGEVVLCEQSIEHPEWLLQMHSVRDLEKNPNNALVHPLLEDEYLYDSEKVCVTSKERMYIKTEFGWVYLGKIRVLVKPNLHEELARICKEVILMLELRK